MIEWCSQIEPIEAVAFSTKSNRRCYEMVLQKLVVSVSFCGLVRLSSLMLICTWPSLDLDRKYCPSEGALPENLFLKFDKSVSSYVCCSWLSLVEVSTMEELNSDSNRCRVATSSTG